MVHTGRPTNRIYDKSGRRLEYILSAKYDIGRSTSLVADQQQHTATEHLPEAVAR